MVILQSTGELQDVLECCVARAIPQHSPLFPRSLSKILFLRSWKGAAPPAAQHVLLTLGREREEVSVGTSQCLKHLTWSSLVVEEDQEKEKSKGNHKVDPEVMFLFIKEQITL